MGSRGPKSAAYIALSRHFLPVNENNRINITALARHHNMTEQQVMRAILKAGQRGQAYSLISPDDGRLEWFWRE